MQHAYGSPAAFEDLLSFSQDLPQNSYIQQNRHDSALIPAKFAILILLQGLMI